MSTPVPATQYLNTISAPPSLPPTAGALQNNSSTGVYSDYLNKDAVNAQSTDTGAYEHYVGGSGITAGLLNTYASLSGAMRSTFGLNENELEEYFNSLTTANANALQYTSTGTASALDGSVTSPGSLINTPTMTLTDTKGTSTLADDTKTKVAHFPSSFSGFVDSILAYFEAKGRLPRLVKPANLQTSTIYTAFLKVFQTYQQTSGLMHPVQTAPAGSSAAVSTDQNPDWDIIPGYDEDLVAEQFENAFAAFLKNFPFKKLENLASDGTYNLISAKSFVNTWLNFITSTSTLQSETQDNEITYIDSLNNSIRTLGSSADANQYLLNYQSIYQAFFPTDTEADFQKFFQSFYKKILADPENGGYFLPSHFVSEFFEEVKHKYIRPLMGQGADMNLTKPVLSIIWEVLARIQEMVGIVQQLSVFVSQRLTFLTNYQKAYTNLIASIPTIKAGAAVLGGAATGDEVASTRNAQLGNYRTTLSSYRDQITAQSKGVQSYLDTLSQASSNSLNQGGALLTMLNGLLSIIRAP